MAVSPRPSRDMSGNCVNAATRHTRRSETSVRLAGTASSSARKQDLEDGQNWKCVQPSTVLDDILDTRRVYEHALGCGLRN